MLKKESATVPKTTILHALSITRDSIDMTDELNKYFAVISLDFLRL